MVRSHVVGRGYTWVDPKGVGGHAIAPRFSTLS